MSELNLHLRIRAKHGPRSLRNEQNGECGRPYGPRGFWGRYLRSLGFSGKGGGGGGGWTDSGLHTATGAEDSHGGLEQGDSTSHVNPGAQSTNWNICYVSTSS